MFGLSNEISFVSGYFVEGVQNSQNVRLEEVVFSLFYPPLYINNFINFYISEFFVLSRKRKNMKSATKNDYKYTCQQDIYKL